MIEKLLSSQTIRDLLIEEIGEESLEIIANFKNGATDEYLAEKTGLKVTVVRAVLNKLNFHGIVSYDRKRDVEAGWYTYTWKLDPKRIVSFAISKLLERKRRLEREIEELSQGQWYVCENECVRMGFNEAMNNKFSCPVCGTLLMPEDPSERIEKLRGEIEEIEREIEVLEEFK